MQVENLINGIQQSKRKISLWILEFNDTISDAALRGIRLN
jgi:hypothetical protein